MTVEKNFFILCENFLLDERQRASLINIYDNIGAESFPATHPLLKYVANVKVRQSGSKKKIMFSIQVVGPNNEVLAKVSAAPSKIASNLKEQNVGAVFDIQMITFPKAGTYTATLSVDEGEVARHAIEVKKHLPQET